MRTALEFAILCNIPSSLKSKATLRKLPAFFLCSGGRGSNGPVTDQGESTGRLGSRGVQDDADRENSNVRSRVLGTKRETIADVSSLSHRAGSMPAGGTPTFVFYFSLVQVFS